MAARLALLVLALAVCAAATHGEGELEYRVTVRTGGAQSLFKSFAHLISRVESILNKERKLINDPEGDGQASVSLVGHNGEETGFIELKPERKASNELFIRWPAGSSQMVVIKAKDVGPIKAIKLKYRPNKPFEALNKVLNPLSNGIRRGKNKAKRGLKRFLGLVGEEEEGDGDEDKQEVDTLRFTDHWYVVDVGVTRVGVSDRLDLRFAFNTWMVPFQKGLKDKHKDLVIPEFRIGFSVVPELPHKMAPQLQKLADEELHRLRQHYEIIPAPRGLTMPGTTDWKRMPRDEEYDSYKDFSYYAAMVSAYFNGAKDVIARKLSALVGKDKPVTMETFHEYIRLDAMKNAKRHVDIMTWVGRHWHEDQELGRQMLQGPSPVFIRRLLEFPAFLERGASSELRSRIEKLIKEERGFYVDFTDGSRFLNKTAFNKVEGPGKISKTEFYHMAHCFAVFEFDEENTILRPIAIRLTPRGPIFQPPKNPNEIDWTWRVARFFLRNRESQDHLMIAHLLESHIVIDPVIAATRRQLPAVHPLFKILRPHMKYTLDINRKGSHGLLTNTGLGAECMSGGADVIDQLMPNSYKSWSVHDMAVPDNLKARNIEEKHLKGLYFWRDDVVQLWNHLSAYVEDFLARYYQSDNDLKEDHYVQNWLKDITTDGHVGMTDGRPGGEIERFPSKITERKALYKLITTLIYLCTAKHSAVNYPAFGYYSFIPNMPSALILPAPTAEGQVKNEDDAVKFLPPAMLSYSIIGVGFALSSESDREVYLGQNDPHELWTDQAHPSMMKFHDALLKMQIQLEKRNKAVQPEQPGYIYMMPYDRLLNSIVV